jgi:hypothetical protein
MTDWATARGAKRYRGDETATQRGVATVSQSIARVAKRTNEHLGIKETGYSLGQVIKS